MSEGGVLAGRLPLVPAELGVSLETLASIQKRVLWIAVSIVQCANRVRPPQRALKVGGHQASSASMVGIMTALWLGHLHGADRVSVKPHASPVLHALNYLLGGLSREWLGRLRSYGGLQSYPSRLKDPGRVDFSTGSMGIGATATIWSAIAHRYVADRFEVPAGGRQIALLGDAELDEGACWEAIVDPTVPHLGELLWIVDVNRQSLDRVVPGAGIQRISGMFAAAGWECIELRYGHRLERLFALEGGDALRRRLDSMPNEEYQLLLRSPAAELRERLPPRSGDGRLRALLAGLDDGALRSALRDLGGHDLTCLLEGYRRAAASLERPTVIFAHTIKGWMLPGEGDPENHSRLLSDAEWRQLAVELDADPDDPWAPFPEGSEEARRCREAGERLRPDPVVPRRPPPVPAELGEADRGTSSTQQSFGRLLRELHRREPELARRIVTVSPDVASSTNLGGWINAAGVWSPGRRGGGGQCEEGAIRWRESERGQHIELGIAETSLTGLLAELGLSWARDGQPLLPIGTVYDPFVGRALEPWSFGLYAGGQSILVGTPSGVTLAPEGGAHQSITTPSIGLEQPRCIAWEPAFAQDLEWTLLKALSRLGKPGGVSAYFRLSTRPVDQKLAAVPEEPRLREARRLEVVSGGYRPRCAPATPAVTLVGMGAIMPNVLAAADELARGGVAADVVCLTSPSLVFAALRSRRGLGEPCDESVLDRLFPPERAAPIVTVLDGHPHTLAFLGGIHGMPSSSLGVDDFGESGDPDDLYARFGIDADTIAGAAVDLLPRVARGRGELGS